MTTFGTIISDPEISLISSDSVLLRSYIALATAFSCHHSYRKQTLLDFSGGLAK